MLYPVDRGMRRGALLPIVLMLSACGGGGGGVSSTPTPTPAPSTVTTPTPTPVNYDTAEYRRSDGPSYHGALTAYQDGASGAGVTVGIIDTGIATANSEFTGRISADSASFTNTGTFEDADGHGTAVATILAGARNNQGILGMAWGATIMALRTDDPTDCNSDGCSHPVSAIAAALDHAVSYGAKVVNMSLGGDVVVPQQMIDSISRATAAGTIVVISAGNDSAAGPDLFAATLANSAVSHGLVILATSNNADGTHSSFANGAAGYETVTISALGDQVTSQDQTGTYYYWTGTSMSAPQVSGAVALLLQAFPNLTPQQAVALLLGTARDAGASGADAEFGMGILDVAAAFAPSGVTTLGNSTTAISLTNNGSLSPAMGDAGATTTQAVMIDAIGRVYSIALQRSLGSGAPHPVLTPLARGPMRRVAMNQGPLSFAMSYADRKPWFDRDGREMRDEHPGDFSSEIAMTLGRTSRFAFGINRSTQDMAEALAPGDLPAFLVARGPERDAGFERQAGYATLFRHRLNRHLALTMGGESGVLLPQADPARQWDYRRDRYQSFSTGLGWQSGILSTSLSGTWLREDNSLLGARLASFFGVGGGVTRFLDGRATFALPGRWTASFALRRGWTSALGGGHAALRSQSWSVGMGGPGLFDRRDRFGLRLAQPLRVEGGGIDAWLPVSYDYAAKQALWQSSRVSLSPSGREMDAEMSYGLPAAGGWLSLNGYARRQPGHIAAAAPDIGGALRFSIGY